MDGFVLELEGDAKHYYIGYTNTGPEVGPLNAAYLFPKQEYAENVIGGDVRLKGAKVRAARRNDQGTEVTQ